jgi:hypothetical protein
VAIRSRWSEARTDPDGKSSTPTTKTLPPDGPRRKVPRARRRAARDTSMRARRSAVSGRLSTGKGLVLSKMRSFGSRLASDRFIVQMDDRVPSADPESRRGGPPLIAAPSKSTVAGVEPRSSSWSAPCRIRNARVSPALATISRVRQTPAPTNAIPDRTRPDAAATSASGFASAPRTGNAGQSERAPCGWSSANAATRLGTNISITRPLVSVPRPRAIAKTWIGESESFGLPDCPM